MAQVQAETDAKVAMDLMRQADNIVSAEYPMMPLYYRSNSMLLKGNVQGVLLTSLNNLYFKGAEVVE